MFYSHDQFSNVEAIKLYVESGDGNNVENEEINMASQLINMLEQYIDLNS